MFPGGQLAAALEVIALPRNSRECPCIWRLLQLPLHELHDYRHDEVIILSPRIMITQMVENSVQISQPVDTETDKVGMRELLHDLQCRIAPVLKLAIRALGRKQYGRRRMAIFQ